ncbi:MAG: hypothetical protein M1298_04245 [Chloroflexi bacterium]|nr:hypothetical protein [Chloroflexota bacterium]
MSVETSRDRLRELLRRAGQEEIAPLGFGLHPTQEPPRPQLAIGAWITETNAKVDDAITTGIHFLVCSVASNTALPLSQLPIPIIAAPQSDTLTSLSMVHHFLESGFDNILLDLQHTEAASFSPLQRRYSLAFPLSLPYEEQLSLRFLRGVSYVVQDTPSTTSPLTADQLARLAALAQTLPAPLIYQSTHLRPEDLPALVGIGLTGILLPIHLDHTSLVDLKTMVDAAWQLDPHLRHASEEFRGSSVILPLKGLQGSDE